MCRFVSRVHVLGPHVLQLCTSQTVYITGDCSFGPHAPAGPHEGVGQGQTGWQPEMTASAANARQNMVKKSVTAVQQLELVVDSCCTLIQCKICGVTQDMADPRLHGMPDCPGETQQKISKAARHGKSGTCLEHLPNADDQE